MLPLPEPLSEGFAIGLLHGNQMVHSHRRFPLGPCAPWNCVLDRRRQASAGHVECNGTRNVKHTNTSRKYCLKKNPSRQRGNGCHCWAHSADHTIMGLGCQHGPLLVQAEATKSMAFKRVSEFIPSRHIPQTKMHGYDWSRKPCTRHSTHSTIAQPPD